MIKKKICGFSRAEIRKAFHSNQVAELLDKALAIGQATPESLVELEEFLEKCKRKKHKIVKQFNKYIIQIDSSLPIIEENETEEERKKKEEEFKRWQKEVVDAVKRVREILSHIRGSARGGGLLDYEKKEMYGLELATSQGLLRDHALYWERKYLLIVLEFMDRGFKKAEAEFRARTSSEYLRWRQAKNLSDDAYEAMLMTKKVVSGQY